MKIQKKKIPLKKKIFVATGVILVITLATVYYFYFGIPKNDKDAKAPTPPYLDSPTQSPQEDTPDRDKNLTETSQQQAVDTGGNDFSENNPIIKQSSNQDLSLYGLDKGSRVSNNQKISGKSVSDTVYYRIEDNERGVISQGNLKTKNRVYSATLNIQPAANSGLIEVYNLDSQGAEINNIKIEVNFIR